QVQRVAAHGRVDAPDVVAGQVAECAPRADPQDGTDGVEHQEPQPRHLDDAGNDPIQLAQPFDEARHDNDLAAVTPQEAFGLVRPPPGEPYVLAVPKRGRVAAEPADGVADVVPGDGCQHGDNADNDDVQPVGARVYRGGDQNRLPRGRHPEVLHENESAE